MSILSERDAALLQVQRTSRLYCLTPVVFFPNTEATIVRDTYESIAQFTQAGGKSIYAWPMIHEPNERELDRAGIYERCELLIWTPMKDWTDLGLTFERIDPLRSTVVVFSADDVALEYKIRQKARASRFADTDLQITLALAKRE